MKKFWSSKKFWLIFWALILIGFFVYFVFFSKKVEFTLPFSGLPEEIKTDKIPPSTAILSPEDKSWWNHDFKVTIEDSDLGSGLIDFLPHERGCRYIIEDLGTNRAIGGFRECDPVEINVPVGEGKTCSSSYSEENPSLGKCKVSTLAFDLAGNESGWKSRVFNIDLIRPEVSPVKWSGPGGENQNLEPKVNYFFESAISDNSKIAGCWFFVDGINTEKKVKIVPIPCEERKECQASVNYSFQKEGDYSVRFGCSDIAGNLGFGKAVTIKVVTNRPPEITVCKVSPGQGNISTEFQFMSQVTDSEGDQISYLWDFGDGKTSDEENVSHYYLLPGTYEPKLIATDVRGGESKCQVAWIVVTEH